VKIATFNINNINKRLDNLMDWLAKAGPDVVSPQELKAEQRAFPTAALRTLKYEAVQRSREKVGVQTGVQLACFWWPISGLNGAESTVRLKINSRMLCGSAYRGYIARKLQ